MVTMKPAEMDVRALSRMTSRLATRLTTGLAVLGLALAAASPLAAQDVRRAEATRAELEASLAEMEQYIASSGYSGRLRDEKRREAQLIRARLEEGDLQVGDSVDITVVGETTLSGTFSIMTGRVLSLPGLPDIPVRGVLRSEARDYFTAQVAKYIRDPQLQVRTKIRLGVSGSVGRPGWYHMPADMLATDAFMMAGGPAGTADMSKAFVRRGGEVIWPRDSFRDALQQGLTLDQLNLRAGDELWLDPQSRVRSISPYAVLGTISAITSLVYLIQRIF
jgi:hypothetical protein